MKRFVALLLALGILVAAGPIQGARDEKKEDKKVEAKKEDKEKPKTDEKPSSSQKQELKKLTGAFSVTVFERDGKKSADDELKKMKVVQKGAEWSFYLGDTITQGKDTVYPDKSPKEIDSLYTSGEERDKTVKGIYEISDDTIKYCWAAPGKERPKDFATKADSGLTYMVLKRVKEEKSSLKDADKKDAGKKDAEKKDDKKDKDK